MWMAFTFSAVATAGTAFMIWFLLGLLRERGPWKCYRIIPVRLEPEKGRLLKELTGIHVDSVFRATECQCSDYYVTLLESEGHAKECASGLIAVNVHSDSVRVGWRSTHPKRFDVFDNRGL
jgi:hypothetical protein